MKVKLLSYTGMGMPEKFAPALLIFTKSTRLEMRSNGIDGIMDLPESEMLKELEYMSNTIPSSWEFVDYIFIFEDVTRAFTHQIVRTRSGTYAQQTMRILNVDGFTHEVGPSIEKNEELREPYEQFVEQINEMYNWLIQNGAEIEDARGILPTNIHTNIVVKFNLRTLAEIAQKRSSPRTQGEYRKVLDLMIENVLDVHPWAKLFLRNRKIESAAKLDEFISSVATESERVALLKAVDILRG